VACTLLFTAPHFGANLVYHRNPLYPFAQDIFTGSTPTVPGAAAFADYLLRSSGSHPPTTLLEQVKTLAIAVATFPCHPHVAESGVLFAVALVLAFLLPRARALWLAWLFAVSTLVVWNLTYPQGRNLEGVLPVVAVVTGAVLLRALRLGRLARLGVGLLLLFQVMAGLDSFFASPDRIANAVSLIRSSHERRADTRFLEYQRDYLALGHSLPKHAVVLMHTMHTNLGIDRPVLHDGFGFQSLIDPRTFRTMRDFYLRLRELGVTHIVYEPRVSAAVTRQGQVVFDVFAARYQGGGRSFGSMRVFAMPEVPPPEEPAYEVLVANLPEQRDGLYDVSDLGVVEDLPRHLRERRPPKEPLTEANALALLTRARAVLYGRDAKLPAAASDELAARFERHATYSDFSVFVRKPQ
jgi:hypothetical protein